MLYEHAYIISRTNYVCTIKKFEKMHYILAVNEVEKKYKIKFP